MISPSSTPPSDFAALLRRFRLIRGLSQEELAARAGISVTAVSYLERGLTRMPHKDTIQLLISALDLASDDAASLHQAARRGRSIVDERAPAAANGTSAPTLAATQPAMSAPTELPTHAPPVERSSPNMRSYRLSPPLTPLLGREHEEAGAVHLLAQERVRLLTLTGPAGVGKTRLALQVAATLRDQYSFELALVDLVAVSSAEQVPQAIAEALGVRQTGDLSLLDAMTAALSGRRVLLLLDNFEHVMQAAPLCVALLGACPRAKGLVTSRSVLNIRGEHEFVVPPLRVPDLRQLPPLADLQQAGAVALFVERARAVRPDFALNTPERARLVVRICARLDGVPLAVELAAAQVRHFPLEDLATRLQGAAPLDVLVGGPRDLADHQRAMRSTIAWSYGLLSTQVQRVFRALGVFVGGATEDGIRKVTELDDEQVEACLTSLADTSLARRMDLPDHEPGETRYDLLVIVRAYALELLGDAGELEAARQALADYVVGLIEALSLTATNVETAKINRLLREQENLRAVLEWLIETGQALVGLRLASRLRTLWETRGLAAEGAEWMERLLAHAEAPKSPDELDAHVEAWKVLVVMRHRLYRFQSAVEAAERVLELTREQGDPGKVAQALHYLANPLGQLGEFDRAEAMLLEGLEINRASEDKLAEMITLINLGDLRNYQGRYDEALALGREALALSRSLAEQEPSLALILCNLGETYILLDRPDEARTILLESQQVYDAYNQVVALALNHLGRACWRLASYGSALEYLGRTMRLSRQQDDIATLVQALCVVAGVALDMGQLALVRQALDEASAVQVRVGDQRLRWRVVERLAGYAFQLGFWETAVTLYAAAERGRSLTRDMVDPAERELRTRDRATALKLLTTDAFAAAERAGTLLALGEALEVASATLAPQRTP